MTTQKLYEILTYLDSLDNNLRLQSILENIRNSLNNIASAPAQPQHQNSLASALTELDQASAELKESITPSQRSIIEAMGGQQFFDPSIAGTIRAYVEKNAMTPSVARDFVQTLVDQRATFLASVRGARQNLEKLKITSSPIAEGSADLAFLIPRDMFDNELGQFAKELNFLNRLLGHYSEALTPDAKPIQLEQLSSSVPTVALVASVPVIGAIAFAVNKFLEAWEKIERIRKIRAELSEMAIKDAALQELEERITTTVDEVVEESTQHVLLNYKGSGGRVNELRTNYSRHASAFWADRAWLGCRIPGKASAEGRCGNAASSN